MSNEENHYYSLLLLRLSRTKDFLNPSPEFRKNLLDSFYEEIPFRNNFHLLSRHSKSQSALNQHTNILQNVPTMITGEAGLNGDSMEIPYTKSNLSRNISVEPNTLKNLFYVNSQIIFHNDQPISSSTSQIYKKIDKLYNVKKNEFQPHIAFASQDYISREWPFKFKQRKIWPIPLTNTTRKIIPAPYWPVGKHELLLNGQIKHNEAGISQLVGLNKRQLLYGKELPLKNKLIINKLSDKNIQLKNKLEQTSYGGSFATNPPRKETKSPNSFLTKTNLLSTNTFMKAPPFKIIPTVNTETLTTTIMQRPYNKSKKIPIIKYVSSDQQENLLIPTQQHPFNNQQQKNSALIGLLKCCQQTAPGCGNLCSKDVKKEEVILFNL